MAGMFKRAEKLEAPKSAAKKKGKEQILVKGVKQLAILDALIKQATAMQTTLKSQVTEVGFEKFVGMAGGTRPSSFEGVDGEATASIEVRKRSTASALTKEELEVLSSAKITAKEQIKTPHLFAINPAFASDQKLLEKVEKALEKIVPKNFIVEQEEVKTSVVTDEMLDDAFSNKASEEVLRILTTMAVKPKLSEDYDMSNLLKDAMKIMG
jgi:hypothetical protein